MSATTSLFRPGDVCAQSLSPPHSRFRRRDPTENVEAVLEKRCFSSDPAPKVQKDIARALGSSRLFREYQRAFGKVTGLPLTLRPVAGWQLAHQGDCHQNAFCALISPVNRCCSACLQMQQRVCEGIKGSSLTMKCVLGIHETAVAVRIGENIVAYLQTGQIFLTPPTAPQTKRALHQLAAWGVPLDAGQAERSYQATPVVPAGAYRATVRLLEFFSVQLGMLANEIVLQQQPAESGQITRARLYIGKNFQTALSLDAVAREVGMSRFYFCRMFKREAGINYTQYVKRTRVEHAKNLLLNVNYRISEIAYAVGFQSLTHFNRAFKSVVGRSPSGYREQAAAI